MSLQATIQTDLQNAMKSGDDVAKQTLRMVKSELMKREVDLGRPLEAAEELAVLTSAVKMRNDAVEDYEKAGRKELADAERAQIEVIRRYLPAQLGEAEAREAIQA